MDDLSEKIGELLGDPESMERIRAMADQLLGGKEEPTNAELPDTAALLKIVSRLKQRGSEQEKLLLALRPHLGPERQARLDTAVRFLKLADLAPLLQDSGLLGL